jgi:hypothetical protein
VLVDEQFRKCVTFLYADKRAAESQAIERVPVGSCFFVGFPISEVPDPGDNSWAYVVTARHVVDGPDFLYLRLRTNDGGFRDLPFPPGAWVKNSQTDVAVAIFRGGSGDLDLRTLRPDQFATEEFVREHQVGEGDEVFFSGLFVPQPGRGVPQPIIRFGNVALMPREPVRVQVSRHPSTFREVEAYLTEARSWGGQSGSPAFLSFGPDRHAQRGRLVAGGVKFALLGLVQGIWTVPAGADAPDPGGEGVAEINMGISVVIPAYKITETLATDEAQQQRDYFVKKLPRNPEVEA